MAVATVSYLGSYTTVKSYGGAAPITVQMVSFITGPTGISCEYGVPYQAFITEGGAAGSQPLVQALADEIETVAAAVPCVVGGTFVQDVNPSTGLLDDYVRYQLAHTNATTGAGPFTTEVDVLVSDLETAGNIGQFQNFIPAGSYQDPTSVVGTACQSLIALAGG